MRKFTAHQYMYMSQRFNRLGLCQKLAVIAANPDILTTSDDCVLVNDVIVQEALDRAGMRFKI